MERGKDGSRYSLLVVIAEVGSDPSDGGSDSGGDRGDGEEDGEVENSRLGGRDGHEDDVSDGRKTRPEHPEVGAKIEARAGDEQAFDASTFDLARSSLLALVCSRLFQ